MTDAVTASIIGGLVGIIIKVLDVSRDNSKRKSDKDNAIEEQRNKFTADLMERLEVVGKERDEAQEEADEYKSKFLKEYEARINKL